MADAEGDQETRRALESLSVVQSMIDVSADRLEGLRTLCVTSAELTQQEIRTLEGKLIKLFSRQLVARARLKDEDVPPDLKCYPSLEQWLQVVGLGKDSVEVVCKKIGSLEMLQEKSDRELRNLLSETSAKEEEHRRLSRALHNLKKYTEILMRGEKPNETSELHLYWDSWDQVEGSGSERTSPRPPRTRAARSSVTSEECLQGSVGSTSSMTASSSSSTSSLPYSTPTHHNGAPLSPPVYPHGVINVQGQGLLNHQYTPPTTPPVIKGKGGEKVKFPTTPPPRKKHQTGLPSGLIPDYPLTKSKSHESQLANRIENSENNISMEQLPRRRGRLPTEPGPNLDHGQSGHNSPLLSSPVKSPPYKSNDSDDGSYKSTLQVPKSPRTPTISRSMGHVIAHRFTKTFKVTTCDLCFKQMFIGLKCKECKFKCHRDCEPRVPPSCGLPPELLDAFVFCMQKDVESPILTRTAYSTSSHPVNFITNFSRRKKSHPQQPISIPPFPGPDSSSNTSSCNSSTPSSPALMVTQTPPSASRHQQFHFPDVLNSEKDVTLETHPLVPNNEMVETQKSNDSDKTVSGTSGSGSTDSERTIAFRVDSQDSQVSDGEPVERPWPRQNSLSLREWDIPFDELKIGEPIGTGRFGTVYRGNWHGDVAIKVLSMDYLDDDQTLEAFKLEVATFRKTRHENLVLFMGACMKLPRLAIVTSMCKGMTLYTHIHLRKDKFNMNKTTIVAQQISQGMGYLHARGIVHKDLKSKNIFLENGKVVITDFGLFSVTKLCYDNRKREGLSIPPGWLCYLSPEIIRSLRANEKHDEDELPFTKTSDVYAFGTVWYELLCGEWPFKGHPPEAIIWQVGKGMKQSLANLQASRDVKDILMRCWSYKPSERLDFSALLKTLEKLPKRRLARSPSHPIHLSRSAESVF